MLLARHNARVVLGLCISTKVLEDYAGMNEQGFYDQDPTPGRKFFISYRRNADDDCFLADYLKTNLEAAGHQVFIDVGLPVGTDWAKEIGERIAWCDHLVALLSEESIQSEMVLEEVRMAHHRKREDGGLKILPVRVNYGGPLNVELSSYISPLQYVSWNGEFDSEHVLNKLIEAVSPIEVGSTCALHEAPGSFEQKTAEPALGQRGPIADHQALLRAPGGACKIEDPLYVERRSDGIIKALSDAVGETIVIKASRQMGKSSLLARYLENCYKANKSIVDIKFQIFTDAELENYTTLLQRIAEEIQRSLTLRTPDVSEIDSQGSFIYFLEDHVLKQIGGPVTFAFDGADRVLGQVYQHDFFGMLRLWHNKRATFRSPWAEVDLALAIATEPYLLIGNAGQSPFSVAVPIELSCLSENKITELNGLYGYPLNDKELNQLFQLLAGHPHLTRLAFFRLKSDGMTFVSIAESAVHTDGPFGDHLRAMLLLLQRQPQLLASFKKLIRDRSWQPDENIYYRLHSAGLACRRHNRIEPANQLYADFFAQIQ